MTTSRAILCLFLAVGGCVMDGAGGPAALSTASLCGGVEGYLDTNVVVNGPFATDVVSPNGGSVVRCEPGTCCNITYYAPTIACADGTRITVVMDPSIATTDPGALSFVCTDASDDLRPSEACPVSEPCTAELGRVTSLTGRLGRYAGIDGGPERLTLVVTSATATLPPEGDGI